MNNHMSLKLVGANSSLELNSPITSIYLQEELTGLTTLPGIRETKGMNIGMDGGWTSAQFYEPRLITIKGVIANQDVAVVEQRRKQLIQLLAEKRLALEFQTEAGNHYTMNVVVAGVQMPLSKVLAASYFQLNLRADDPLIYDNNALAELEAILRRSSSASSGFSINFPINFQLGVSESRPTIDNFGSSVIYPTITLTGPLTTPEIVNITTNMAFTIDEVLGAGTYTASGIRGAMTQEGSIDTYSGNPIQTTRDAESPISKFQLLGDAEQTTYSGKNLCSSTEIPSGAFVYFYFPKSAITAGAYRLSVILNDSTANNTVGLMIDGTGVSIGATMTGSANQRAVSGFSLSESIVQQIQSATTVFLRLYKSGGNFSSATEAMLEKGTSVTAYEPYVGGTASPNPDYPQAVNTVTGEETVKIEGKNLCAPANIINGCFVDYSQLAGENYTETWNTKYRVVRFDSLPAGTYTFSINWNATARILRIGADGQLTYVGQDTNTYTFTTTTTGLFGLTLRNTSATDFSDDDFTIQVELGSTATAYEPYQGQALSVNLGKNLFDKDNANVLNAYLSTTAGVIVANSTDRVVWLKINKNSTYTVSLTQKALSTATSVDDFAVGIYTTQPQIGSSGTRLAYTPRQSATADEAFSLTFDSGANEYVAIKVANTSKTDFNATLATLQLELGSATAYAPYFTPIELCKIGNYQDRIYKSEGKWYIYKEIGKVILDGTENWADYTWQETGFYKSYETTKGKWGNAGNFASSDSFLNDHFASQGSGWSSYVGSSMASTGYAVYIKVPNSVASDLATFKTWLTSNPTTVYYALATPTTTEITEQALIDQLDAILEAHLYESVNNISNVTISPNLAGDLEIKTGQTLTVINSLSIVGSSGTAEIDLGGSELAMVGSVADELTINGTTGAVTKTARIGKIASYAGETITTDYISTSGGLDSDATIYYVLPSSSTSVINTLDSTALTAFNNVVASGGVSAQTNLGSISVDVTTVTAQDVAVVDTKQHTVTINGVGAYSKFSGDWLTLDVGLNELQLITENNTDTGSAVIKYRVGYMGV